MARKATTKSAPPPAPAAEPALSKKAARKARRRLLVRIEVLKDEISELDQDIRHATNEGVFSADEKRLMVLGLDQAWHSIDRPSLARGRS